MLATLAVVGLMIFAALVVNDTIADQQESDENWNRTNY